MIFFLTYFFLFFATRFTPRLGGETYLFIIWAKQWENSALHGVSWCTGYSIYLRDDGVHINQTNFGRVNNKLNRLLVGCIIAVLRAEEGKEIVHPNHK